MSCLHLDITIISIYFPPHVPPINPTQKPHLPFLTPPKTSSAFDQSESKKLQDATHAHPPFRPHHPPIPRHEHPSPRRPTRNQRYWQLRRHTKLDRPKRSVRLRRLSRPERPGHLQRLLGQPTRHLRRRSLRLGLQCYAWWPGQHDVHCPGHLSGLSGR